MPVSFEIKSSALPHQATVAAFRGTEGISRPYVFDVYVNVIGPEEVEIDDTPGSRATLIINDPEGLPIRFDGMIASMELLRAISLPGTLAMTNTLYRVRIVPNLWQLSLTKHSRIWTQKSIPDVIKEVLEEEGIHRVEMRLHGSYDVEEHVCQYKESSLNFIHRWMEREGMYYFFEQGEAGETLIITDSNATSTLSRLMPIPYHSAGEGDAGPGAHLDTFTWRHAAMPADVRFIDYDYTKPALDVQGKASVSPIGVGEQVTYGNRFFTPKQGNTLATVRAEDLRAQAKTFHGSGSALGISSGYRFLVEGHPKLQMNAEYLAVTVEHFGLMHGARSWGKAIPHEHTETYRVDFTAISSEQQYRHPELAAWPRLDGYENAVVDGPATSDYAQIDSHGRYNVKFKFDEGTLKSGKASTWVRKMQPHAGTVEGWHFPERAGTEVICAFLGGDPDRPIIIGAIPTAVTPSPVTNSNHTQNVIQTGGKNRVEMEDLAGQQRVTISTPHAKSFITMGFPLSGLSQVYNGDQAIPDHTIAIITDGNKLLHSGGTTDQDIGNNWNVWVASNHIETVDGSVNHFVGVDVEQEIMGTLDQEVHGAVSEEYHSTLTQGVQAAVEIEHKATFKHTVDGSVTEEFGATTQTVKGNHSFTVEGNQNIEITGNKGWHVDGFWNHSIEGPKSETVAGIVTNLFLGMKTELTGGVKIDVVGGARIDMTAGVQAEIVAALHIDIAPAKINMYPEKLQISAADEELKGIHTNLEGLNTKVAGLESKTAGLDSDVSGLKRKMHGVQNQITALHSMINGLTSIV